MEINGLIIDTDDAMKRLGGNMALFKKLLAKFDVNSQIAKIEEAIASGDAESYLREVHTIKGTAGNLSCTALYNIAASLELEMKTNGLNGSYSALFGELKAIAATTAGELEKI